MFLAGAAGLATLPLIARPARAAASILRVHGAIGAGPGPGERSFDAAAFDALPQSSFRTTTPWHTGVVEFSGVAARDLFAAIELRAANLKLVALNDYVVDAEAAEIVRGDGLFATRQDGVPMPVSDKGPVFLLFPFDARDELRHQSFVSRAVWQLCEIDAVS